MSDMAEIAKVYLRILMDRAAYNPEPPDDVALANEALEYADRALNGGVPTDFPPKAAVLPGDQVTLRERVAALASEWEQASDEMRERAVREGLHPLLARGHAEANRLMERAADLRAVLAGVPR